MQWTGDGGFSANGGPLTVSMSPGVPMVWGSTTNFLGNGNVLTFGSPTANSQVNFTDSLDLSGGSRQIDVAAGLGGDIALISGNIIDSLGGGGLLKTGAGTLILSGSNSFVGGTTVASGTLRIGNAAALGAASSPLVVNGGVLDLQG